MQFFGHIIVRLVWIAIGVGLALVAASIFLSAGLLGGAFDEFFADLGTSFDGGFHDPEPIITTLVVFTGLISSFHLASLAALPMMIAIVIAEAMRWQGMTINLVLGGLVALATGMTTFSRLNEGMPSDGTLVVLLAAGFVGGFFYWLAAGRSAGNWLRPNRETIAD